VPRQLRGTARSGSKGTRRLTGSCHADPPVINMVS
jgi:hypothetical protein